MPQIILPELDIPSKEEIHIIGQNAHYLVNVLRLKIDDEFQILGKNGNLYRARIISTEKKIVKAKIVTSEYINTESSLHLVYVQAILKGEKMDFLIQKATELGVKEIYPVVTTRTIVRQTGKYQRWLRIAQESVRQCGRRGIPLIHEPTTFKSFLEKIIDPVIGGENHGCGYIFYEDAQTPIKNTILNIKHNKPVYSVIGPEGGFTPNEIELAQSRGLLSVRLGPRILRAETAALIALGLIQFLYGDIN